MEKIATKALFLLPPALCIFLKVAAQSRSERDPAMAEDFL